MKRFRLADISRNTNSFGLRGCILVAQDGEAWEVGSNDVNCPQRGKDYWAPVPLPENRGGRAQDEVTAEAWAGRGWEIPRRLIPNAPQAVIDIAWPKEIKT
jgi:hypothetical protein